MTALVGRDSELAALKQHLATAVSGKGSTVLISGEPGIGKTALVDAFKEYAATQNVKILSGAASADSAQPFLVFSKALAGEMDVPLFEEQEYTRFVKIFAINHAGMLVAQASSGEGDMDADIFAGMLSAVQNFVCDSLDTAREQKSGLGRLEYGDMKILIEHGKHLFLTGVFSGGEHPDMKSSLKRTLHKIEEEHDSVLQKWSGKVSEVEPVHQEIMKLSEAKFLVRRDLEGVTLENERLRIADRVLKTLTSLSGEKAAVILLEDLHWTDESSLFVLNYLARNIRGTNIFLLGTARLRENALLDSAAERMRKEEIFTEMELNKLEMRDVIGLIECAYPDNDFPSEFTDSLTERCGGNPLFVTEFLREMSDEGAIAKMDGKYVLVRENYAVPESVEELIQNRLSRLTPEALTIAEYASCIGKYFTIDVAMSIGTVINPESALKELHDSKVIIGSIDNAEFSHVMYQDVIYSTISPRWKSTYHKSIGLHFENTNQRKSEEVVYELAKHFSRTNEYMKAFNYCVRAGEKAEQAYAVELAAEYYEQSLVNLPKLGGHYMDGREKIKILERIGDLYVVGGMFDKALQSYAAIQETDTDGKTAARILRKMASVNMDRGANDLALSALAQAANELGDDKSSEYGRICLVEGNVHFGTSDYDKALSLYLEAINLFDNQDSDPRDMGNALRAIGNIHFIKSKIDIAIDFYERSYRAMEGAGDKHGVAMALNNKGNVLRVKGDFDSALNIFKKSLDIMHETGNKKGVAMVLGSMGLISSSLGEYEKAIQHYKQSLRTFETIGDRCGAAMTLGNMGNVYSKKGDLDNALKHDEKSLEINTAIGDRFGMSNTLSSIGLTYMKKGDTEKAIEYLSRCISLREELKDHHGVARTHGYIAIVNSVAGKTNEAEAHFSAAKDFYIKNERENDLIKIMFGWAENLVEVGRIDAGRGMYIKTLEFAEKHHDSGVTEKCRKALEELEQ
jgi:tetratricopeptide (TPR) repeat protein